MEPTLMVIGLNHTTAPLAMRERFWIGEKRRYEVLQQLKMAEGIEEIVVLSTFCRTEFLLWASEPTLAANSLLQFLGSQHGLKLREWEHFYRLLDDAALTHIFRVASGLDSLALGEPQAVALLKAAWEQAQTLGAAGRFLNSVLKKAVDVSRQVRRETAIEKRALTLPAAALELARHVFGSLAGRRVLLLGCAKTSEIAARHMVESGAGPVVVIDQSPARAQETAQNLGATAASLADRWKCMLHADIVLSSTGCPHVVLTAAEAERIAEERNRVALLIMDLCVPRDVDPDVRRVDGILLYDLDGVERILRGHAAERTSAAAEAERIVAAEAQAFRGALRAQRMVPTIVALHHRLEEICRQELESFIAERGPFTREQNQSLHALAGLLIQKIASSLAHELKEPPGKEEQERMAAVVARLFHLDAPKTALAGTSLEKPHHEQSTEPAIAMD
ncbi:MAG TPA: glutamyl-tRNA reductase [Candidatus Sulfotelmatobacter sp.]|nr:glutamyl-tRNA reductase [Candidatus Sulfotelmatobacter sp.]